MRHALETTGRTRTFLERRCHCIEAVSQRESTRDCRKRVVDVWWANKRRMKVAFARRSRKPEAHPVQRKLRIASRDLCIAFNGITNYTQSIFLQRLGKLQTVRIIDVDD